MSIKDEVEQFLRRCLQERLANLSVPQRAMFERVYPILTAAKLEDAIDLCDRTIRKNLSDPSRLQSQKPTEDLS
jgi:hypothetical protein